MRNSKVNSSVHIQNPNNSIGSQSINGRYHCLILEYARDKINTTSVHQLLVIIAFSGGLCKWFVSRGFV